ncbi:unnamed protein product [Bursaphelenchus okinawaensis]|uniref:EGF-like domain-containing protein n=1 Tax=Bursaphelenchus okinawaensis TaxID=465554 RepID=A0A811K9P8_9BILA|nr:unnamed protein product [Bursaphelenchus okinawaensis]CAG9094138.1 unnamed protein product [Bursaphelenchus okinawaensis]
MGTSDGLIQRIRRFMTKSEYDTQATASEHRNRLRIRPKKVERLNPKFSVVYDEPSTSTEIPSSTLHNDLTACPEPFNLHYCYNQGECVTSHHFRSLNSVDDMFCQCKNGYHGERCEYSFNGDVYGHDLFPPGPKHLQYEYETELQNNRVTAPFSLVSSAAASPFLVITVLLIVMMLIVLVVISVVCCRRKPESRSSEMFSKESDENTVSDGLSTISYSNPPFVQPSDEYRIYRSTVESDTVTSDSDFTPTSSPIKPLVR